MRTRSRRFVRCSAREFGIAFRQHSAKAGARMNANRGTAMTRIPPCERRPPRPSGRDSLVNESRESRASGGLFNHKHGSLREEASCPWSDPKDQLDPLHPLPPVVIDARPRGPASMTKGRTDSMDAAETAGPLTLLKAGSRPAAGRRSLSSARCGMPIEQARAGLFTQRRGPESLWLPGAAR